MVYNHTGVRELSTLLIIALIIGLSPVPSAWPVATHLARNSTIVYDFESGLQGWDSPSGAITRVEWTADRAKSGQHSMKLTVDLRNSDPNRRNGEIYVDMSYMDLRGKTVSVWVSASTGIRGDLNQPNGIHLFAEDFIGRRLYGTWQYFLEGGWFQVTLPVTNTKPACGSMDFGFTPSLIRRIGINIAIPPSSAATFNGNVYVDDIGFETATLPQSANLFDFQDPEALSHHPMWGLVPGWGDSALGTPTWQSGALALPAHFTMTSDATRKGAVGIIFSPPLDLAYKTHAIISADVRFVPSATTSNNCPFVVSIWAYDDDKKKWFISDDINVGAGEWTRISFDLGDMVQYKPGIKDYAGDVATLDAVRQVVFQFWANTAYDGQLLIDNIALGGLEVAHPSLNQDIVHAENGQFVLNGKPFRFVGGNIEYLFSEHSSTVKEMLGQAASLGASVVRTWGFSEGCEDPTLSNCAIWSSRFQPMRGQWNETAFKHFDQVVAMAAERGLRLIVPLANNWNEYGGRPQYITWLEQEYPGDIPPGIISNTHTYNDLFYTNAHVKQWYKDYVTQFISRTNSITGIRYGEDPTIFAWELINEPRASSDVTGATLHQWLVEMSEVVDGLDSNHMIGTGEEGWYIMPKASADIRARLPDGTVWQNLPGNYWQHGVNWKPPAGPTWSSDGVDFISDHSSTDTQVCWQAYAGESDQAPVECQTRAGVPKIDFTSMHLYIDAGASNLYFAPYCAASFDTTICNQAYDRPYHQAFLWIAEHMSDTLALGKPMIVGEFGFRTSGKGLPSSGSVPSHVPPFQPHHRAQLYEWYLGEMFRQGVNGALFWNLGFDGYPESLWDGADALAESGSVLWRYNFLSDSTNIGLCLGPEHVTQGQYSVCANYDSGKGYGKAFVDRINIPSTHHDWSPEYRHRFRVDVYGNTSLSVIVGLVTGQDQTWYESVPQSIVKGWNTITVDTTQKMWKSAASGWEYTDTVHDLEDVRQVSIGISNYTISGTFYVDNLRHVGNDGLVLYSGDPALASVKHAICQNWRSCVYLPAIYK
jgi:hypothetical protein